MSSKSHEEFSPSGLPTGVYSIACSAKQSIFKKEKTWLTEQSVFCHWRMIAGVQFDPWGTLCAHCVAGCQWCNFSCTAGSNPLAVSCDGHGVHLDVLAEEHNLRVAARVADNLRVAARVADKLRAARCEGILIDNTPPPSYNALQEIYLAEVTERLRKDWPY